MTTITVTKTDEGKLAGATETDRKAYGRFQKSVDELEPGEIFTIDVWFARNPKLDGLHFTMLAAIHDAQEQFYDPEQLRMWLQVGAGHCTFVPGPHGRMIALPKSISHKSIDDFDFAAHHEAVKVFLRSQRATRFLWPHLDDIEAGHMVEAILVEFEKKGGDSHEEGKETAQGQEAAVSSTGRVGTKRRLRRKAPPPSFVGENTGGHY